METPENIFKTPVRGTRNEFKTPGNPTFQTTPLSYSKLTIGSFLRKDQSFSASSSTNSSLSCSLLNTPSDRFIPNRRFSDVEMSNLLLTSSKMPRFPPIEQKSNAFEPRISTQQTDTSPPDLDGFREWKDYYAWTEKPVSRKMYKGRVMALMMDGKTTTPRVLNLSMSLKKKEPQKNKSVRSGPIIKRHIPRFPENILDLPQINENFGSNVVHWDNNKEIMVVGLGEKVFLWHANTMKCSRVPLRSFGNTETIFRAYSKITAVSLNYDAKYLAIAMKDGRLKIYDRENSTTVDLNKSCCPQEKRCYTTSFAWLPSTHHPDSLDTLYIGTKCGAVVALNLHNLEELSKETIHTVNQPIASVSFSNQYTYMAVLTIKGYMTVMKAKECSKIEIKVDALKVHLHKSLTLSWCPWQQNYIATAGLQDKSLKVWNIQTEKTVVEKVMKSSITCVTWFEGHKEILTGHEIAENIDPIGSLIQIWKFPSMELVCRLMGHLAAVIYIGVGVDNTLLTTIGADETLCMWRCFDTFVYKNDKWLPVKNENKEKKEKTSLTKELLSSCFSRMNYFNIR